MSVGSGRGEHKARGKTKTIKQRTVYVYLPSEKAVAAWQKEAEQPDSPMQVWILGALGQKSPQRFKDLVAHLQTTKPTLSRYLETLVSAEAVYRSKPKGATDVRS